MSVVYEVKNKSKNLKSIMQLRLQSEVKPTLVINYTTCSTSPFSYTSIWMYPFVYHIIIKTPIDLKQAYKSWVSSGVVYFTIRVVYWAHTTQGLWQQ